MTAKLRILFVLGLLTIANCAIAENDVSSFGECLRECKGYYGSETKDLHSIKMVNTKQILGMQDGKCIYKEQIKTKDGSYTVKCSFTSAQSSELADAISKFNSGNEGDNVDINDFEQVQNTSVSQAWSKYLTDTNVCSLEQNGRFILNTEKNQEK